MAWILCRWCVYIYLYYVSLQTELFVFCLIFLFFLPVVFHCLYTHKLHVLLWMHGDCSLFCANPNDAPGRGSILIFWCTCAKVFLGITPRSGITCQFVADTLLSFIGSIRLPFKIPICTPNQSIWERIPVILPTHQRLILLDFFFFKDLMYLLERERETASTSQGRNTERGKSRTHTKPRACYEAPSHNLKTMSWAETKSRRPNPQSRPSAPIIIRLLNFTLSDADRMSSQLRF